jgi:arylsulfatase A-like enzyme
MLAGVMAGAQANPLSTSQAIDASQPNIIFVLVDDMILGMMDDLPRLRSLTSEAGLSFTSAYTAAPVCCPSRAAILRGQYPHNNGVLRNAPPQGGYSTFRNRGNESSNIATWLHDAGYRTGLVGKYLNFYDQALQHVPTGWDRWFVYGGQGKYTTYRISDQGKVRLYGTNKKKQKLHYQTDVMARKAVDFITSTPADKPLFLYLAPSTPHEPATPAPRDKKAAVPRNQAPRVPSFNEDDMSDKPPIWSKRKKLGRKQIRDLDRVYVRQVKSMHAVEDMIEDVIAALKATNRFDNAYIVFASDNGFHHGQHRVKLGKNTPFEESTHMPLIVRGPDVPAGATTSAMVSYIDLAPTFAELSGATLPQFVDGRSLVPLFDGTASGQWRDAVICELLRGPKQGFTVLREGSYVYTAYGDGDRELYDLIVDPYQLDNIASSADGAQLADLEARYRALATCGEGGTRCQQADG